MEEIWKSVKGYEGLYEVSNLGRVRSLPRTDALGRPVKGGIMKARPQKGGYMQIHLRDKNAKRKAHTVHRLVGMAFVQGYKEGLDINHKNEKRADNRADNLEWCTRAYNLNYNGCHERSIANHKQARAVIQMDCDGGILNEYASIVQAGKAVGIDPNLIGHVCRCRPHYHTAAGYRWKYKE